MLMAFILLSRQVQNENLAFTHLNHLSRSFTSKLSAMDKPPKTEAQPQFNLIIDHILFLRHFKYLFIMMMPKRCGLRFATGSVSALMDYFID